MTPPALLQITDGQVALSLVDKLAAGYLPTWQAPAGKTAATAVLADYTDANAAWSCQVTNGKLTPSKQSNTLTVPATFCSPEQSTPQPGATTFALDLEYLQDPMEAEGLAAMLYANDTLDAYFLLASGDGGPRAIGRCVLVAGGFLGAPRANLTDSVSLDCKGKPDILFGSVTAGKIVKGDGTVVVIGG